MFRQKSQPQTNNSMSFSLENPTQRKILFWIWHSLIFISIILLILFWQTSIWLLGCGGDFSRLMEKIEILLFVLLLTSPLTRTLRQRLFPKNSPPECSHRALLSRSRNRIKSIL
ncbi:hypothetical protein [Dictyobacter kobayashii]|uniref:hypothetical protein n=1 Tax=Dictyobacter kobayashii TaxID=2014872 RepID=UPI000F837E74|nr:hypothetical protein [Dictyobacter kobayashii]